MRFTRAGYTKLQADYEELKRQRPAAVLDLKKARDMGDLSENGYYKAARAKLSSIDHTLRRFSFFLKVAVISDTVDSNNISIGNTITLLSKKTKVVYHIVGDMESDPKNRKISLLSPVGKAIEGKNIGDTITITIPSGKITYKVIGIS